MGRLPEPSEPSDDELDSILAGAAPQVTAGMREWMKKDIEADEARIANHDEGTRILAAERARREGAVQARRERGQRERVLTEKRRLDAARQLVSQRVPVWKGTPELQAALDEIKANPEFKVSEAQCPRSREVQGANHGARGGEQEGGGARDSL